MIPSAKNLTTDEYGLGRIRNRVIERLEKQKPKSFYRGFTQMIADHALCAENGLDGGGWAACGDAKILKIAANHESCPSGSGFCLVYED
jgi:hypothetical protein